MKRILSMVIICILLPIHITCFAANNICIILDGNLLTFSEAPYIEQGTTMVPMRAVFEALGAEVQYDSQTKKITATKDGINIELWIGTSVVNMNGISKQLPVVVMNKNGSTMVPLRFVSESLGATVDWNSNERTITIQSNGNRNQIQIILNGQPLYFNEAPYIEQGTTMVPMRAVFEALGAEVQYDSQTKKITASKDGINIELWIGASIASVNGISEQLPVVVTNKNESAMVPVRFVSESLGASIDWNDDTRIITIKQENDFIEDALEEDALEEDVFAEDDFTEDTLEEDDFAEDDFTEDTLEEGDFVEDDFAEDEFTEDALEEDEFTEDDFENYEDIYADDPNRDYSVILVAYNPGTIRKVIGAGEHKIGEMVELYVEPADGYEFVEWNIQNGAIPNSSNQTYRFRMPRDAFIIEPIVKKQVEEEKITPKVDIPQTEINFENIAINLEMYAQVEPKGQNVNWSREIVYAFQDEMRHYTVFSIKNKTGQNTTIRSTTPGIARLIASIVVDGKEYVDDCLIMVPGVRITSPDVYESFSGRSESIFVGDTVQLTAEVVPQDSAVIWSSSDTNVATVDRNGKVTAVLEGFCTIKAEINYNGKSYSGFLSIYVFED